MIMVMKTADELIEKAIAYQQSLLQTKEFADSQHVRHVITQLQWALKSNSDWSGDDILHFRVMAGEKDVAPLWVLAHGSAYDVPTEIQQLVDDGTLKDLSYKNDTCPRFETADGNYDIWVEHPECDLREGEGQRFTVVRKEGEESMDVVLETETLAPLLSWIKTRLLGSAKNE